MSSGCNALRRAILPAPRSATSPANCASPVLFLEGDVNGDGVADFRIHVHVESLQRGDLILRGWRQLQEAAPVGGLLHFRAKLSLLLSAKGSWSRRFANVHFHPSERARLSHDINSRLVHLRSVAEHCGQRSWRIGEAIWDKQKSILRSSYGEGDSWVWRRCSTG